MSHITAPKYRGPSDVTIARYHNEGPGRVTAWQILHGLAPGPDGDCDANKTPEGMCPVLCGFAEAVSWSFDDDAARTASCLPILPALVGSETTSERAQARARHLARHALVDYAPECARATIAICEKHGVPCEALKAAAADLTAEPGEGRLVALVEALSAASKAAQPAINTAWESAHAAFQLEHGAAPGDGERLRAERDRYFALWIDCLKQDAAYQRAQWVYDRISWGWYGCDNAASALHYAESDEPSTVSLSAYCAAISARSAGRLREAVGHLQQAMTL